MQGAENHVAGQGSLHGQRGGFRIADLANHDDVRVLAKNRSQTAGKGHAGFTVQLYLPDFFDAVFNRIFHGDNVNFGLIDFL